MERATIKAVGGAATLLGLVLRYLVLGLPFVATGIGLALVARGVWLFDPRIGMIVLGLLLLLVPARFRPEGRR